MLTRIIDEAKMANAIVQEVLEFVRPMRLQMDHASIHDAVWSAVTLAETKAPRGDIAVQIEVPQTLPPIQGDSQQLAQLFTNLLTNAYEAMDGKGRVMVTAELVQLPETPDGGARDAVLVEVADDGPGMPPDVADKIFDPFFTTKAKGSGLGLAIVRKIVDAHDGKIDMKSAPKRGTSIRVTLPVQAAEV
jgi:signal transduction histidine kinase